jgi:hypothetical protein
MVAGAPGQVVLEIGRYGEEVAGLQDVALAARHPVRDAVQLQVDLPDRMVVRLDEELLGGPLLTGVHETADRVLHVGMEAGAQAARPGQGHLKIVSSRLNNGNASG